MSSLQYYAYEAFGTKQKKELHYSQAVRIPAGADRIECSGQGGWDPSDPNDYAIPSSPLEQIDRAFSNVKLALKDAGVNEGWKSVFRVNSYHVEMAGMEEEVLGRMVENFKKYMSNHQPIWTCVGVPALALPEMKVEIEVVAFDEK